MRVEIPLFPEVSSYTETVPLDGVDFKLSFDWNGREDRWYLSLYDSVGVPVRTGMKVTPNWDLLVGCVAANRPAGKLAFLDARLVGFGSREAPGFASLGREVKLVYFSGAELAELEALAGEL